MTFPDLAMLENLRAAGVSTFRFQEAGDEWAVTFFQEPQGMLAPADVPHETLEEARCKCGHALTEHNESSECLLGCPSGNCEQKPQK